MSYSELKTMLNNIELINNIKPNMTIDIETNHIVDHSRWYNTYFRSWNNENRYKTMLWIESVFDEARSFICYLDNLIESKQNNDFEYIEQLESPTHSDTEDNIVIINNEKYASINKNIHPSERKRLFVLKLFQFKQALLNLAITYDNDSIVIGRLYKIVNEINTSLVCNKNILLRYKKPINAEYTDSVCSDIILNLNVD